MKHFIIGTVLTLAFIEVKAQSLSIAPNVGAVWMNKSSFFDTGQVLASTTGAGEDQIYEQRTVSFGLNMHYRTKFGMAIMASFRTFDEGTSYTAYDYSINNDPFPPTRKGISRGMQTYATALLVTYPIITRGKISLEVLVGFQQHLMDLNEKGRHNFPDLQTQQLSRVADRAMASFKNYMPFVSYGFRLNVGNFYTSVKSANQLVQSSTDNFSWEGEKVFFNTTTDYIFIDFGYAFKIWNKEAND